LCAKRNLEKKIVLCKKGDEITGLDGIYLDLVAQSFQLILALCGYSVEATSVRQTR
jgi:hypothetical protein